MSPNQIRAPPPPLQKYFESKVSHKSISSIISANIDRNGLSIVFFRDPLCRILVFVQKKNDSPSAALKYVNSVLKAKLAITDSSVEIGRIYFAIDFFYFSFGRIRQTSSAFGIDFKVSEHRDSNLLTDSKLKIIPGQLKT